MKRFISAVIVLTSLPNLLSSQPSPHEPNGYVKGSVTTSDLQPAEYIQVFIKHTGFGTLSNANGQFGFSAPAGKCTLVVQSIACHQKEFEIEVSAGDTLRLATVALVENKRQLGEVVVTGQFEAQSVRNSVYRVRTIGPEQIAARGAMDLKTLLETQSGIRFTNDLATGESDIELMGMSGQNVKVLLDGVPLIDRGATKQSLSQIDINLIERVEIIEGPMSVMYGTDALAGVINLITKKNHANGSNKLSVTARVQEETVGNEYAPLKGEGKHNNHIGLNYTHKGRWHALANLTRNDFGGWQGSYTGRAKQWKAKDQLMGQGGLGYKTDKLNVWYRLDWLDESIMGLGDANVLTNTATDKDYLTARLTHQLQGAYTLSDKWSVSACASYQNYERATQTTTINLATNDRRLSLDAGAQDVSGFDNLFIRAVSLYKQSTAVSYQFGTEVKTDKASGDRIQGEPHVSDYSAFASAEIKLGTALQLRPGLRFSKNSTYDAPPVIPSLNTKLKLGEWSELRLSYARGFRAPALRELYFWFFDASHSIKGNTDLKAEYSNSYTASFTCRPVHGGRTRVTASVSPFYNQFNNLITTARDANDPSVTTYVNIDNFKTTGATLDLTCHTGSWQLNAGFSYIARYNKYSQTDEYEGPSTAQFDWSPEATFSALYQLGKWKTDILLTYKFTGEKPFHELVTANGATTVHKAYIGEFHWADLTLSQPIKKWLKLQVGARNLLDITNLDNSSQTSGGHSTSGPLPLSYGRSYFAGLILEI